MPTTTNFQEDKFLEILKDITGLLILDEAQSFDEAHSLEIMTFNEHYTCC